MAMENSSLGYPAVIDARARGTSSQKLPLPESDYNLNDNLNYEVYDALYSSTTTNNASASTQNTDEYFARIGDQPLNLNALYDSPTTSALLACVPDGLFDTGLEHDATALSQDLDEDFNRIGDHSSGNSLSIPDHGLETTDPVGRFHGMKPCSSSTRTCMVSALKILQELHIPPLVCLSTDAENSDSSYARPRITDSVLSTNREVVRLVSDMLQCTCSLSSQVQLILIIICGKLLAWYRAIARDGNDGFDNLPSVARSIVNKNNTSHEGHTERVLYQPITVGEYSLDIGLENKIRAQVLFSELQHMGALIKRFISRVEESEVGNGRNPPPARERSTLTGSTGLARPDQTKFRDVIYRSLPVFFHSQLQVAKVEVAQILNGGHGSAGDARQTPG